MNTSSLKSFAPAVRRQLMEAVTRKLDYALTADTPDLRAAAEQVKSLRKEADRDRTGLIERVAYTWFNRLAAIRFLDARGWHPFHARVLTPASAEETQPELLKLVRTGSLPEELRPHTDPDRLNDLLDGRLPTAIAGADPQGEVYRHLVLAVCRFYHATLPFLFERLNDETELLLPDDLLTATSVAEGFRTEISDADCADVEILGWLYQFYIAEKKDAVMARNAAVPKEDIPAVTQLFTPHWIVRYLVENSLGRLWLLNRPQSKLREHMPYYIEGEAETDFLKIAKPEDIRLLDPAAGSAHMLTYAFDLLVKIYEEEGYAPSQIADLILTHNLHGLDICPRAAQLAQFALLCKAREISRSAFRRAVAPKVLCLEDVRFEENELRDYIRALGLGDLFHQPVLKLLHQFEEATNFGSLIQPCLDERAIAGLRNAITTKDLGGQLLLHGTHRKVLRVLEQAEALTQRYHVVVMNPPYLGGNQMNGGTKAFAETLFPNSKADLFAMFIERAFSLAVPMGFSGMITMQSWMFLSTFEDFRAELLAKKTMHNMAHLGARAFDSIGGEVVQATAFIYENVPSANRATTFLRLTAGRCEADKAAACREAIANPNCGWLFHAAASDFRTIPGSPIAYWLSAKALDAFRSNSFLADLAPIREGINTGDNARFLRFWFEAAWSRIDFGVQHNGVPTTKWVPHKKGGGFRRWYGNADYILNWERGGVDIHAFHGLPLTYNGAPMRGKAYFFKHSLSWSRISTANFCIRQYPSGFSYDSTAPSIYGPADSESFVLGFLNSHVVGHLMAALSPKLVVQGNEFGTKVRILSADNSEARFLAYVPAARPPDGENWLLDLLLQGHEFKADRASLAVQEVGLAYEFRGLAEMHVEFFKDGKRTQKLKELVHKDDEADAVRLKMMAVLARTQVEVEAVLLDFLNQAAKEEMFDPVQEVLAPHDLAEPFWREVKRRFGYASLEPSIRDFVIALFRGADPLENQIALSAQGAVFLQRWKDSQQQNPSFRQWSARLERELNVAQRLEAKGDRQDLGDADAFEVFDKFIIHRLCQAFEGERNLDALLRTIQARRQSFWYPHHRDGYLAIHHAVELRERLSRAELAVDSIEAGVERYQTSWWKMDQAYRLCCYHLRSYGQVNLMEGLETWVTKSYVNNYLLPLADRWSDKVRLMEHWNCGSLPAQRQFYEHRVRPFQEKGQKIFVIISDALRYEAAADLAGRINSENRFTAELSAMFGGLPSYTQLGMASLLPGKAVVIDTENEALTVAVDGRSTLGTENRDKILKSQIDGKGVAIQAEHFLALNSKTEGRTLMKENEVIYIFHNVIDKTGDSAATESKTCDAVEQAMEELLQILKKVAAINGSNMLITSDHGFLFQQDEVHQGDATTLPAAARWINRNRRFALGSGIQESDGVKVFSAEQLGLPGSWTCAFPTSLGRFPLQGSGKRYVHGGFSLQEIVIPVIQINKSRSDDTGRVEVELMRVPAKITTGQIAFSLYQEKPVTAKRLPRELRVGIYAPNGTSLSEVKTVKMDSKDEEARNRETNILLVLSVSSNNFNNQTVEIRLDETLPGTNQTVNYKSHPIKLQKPFASDFDDL